MSGLEERWAPGPLGSTGEWAECDGGSLLSHSNLGSGGARRPVGCHSKEARKARGHSRPREVSSRGQWTLRGQALLLPWFLPLRPAGLSHGGDPSAGNGAAGRSGGGQGASARDRPLTGPRRDQGGAVDVRFSLPAQHGTPWLRSGEFSDSSAAEPTLGSRRCRACPSQPPSGGPATPALGIRGWRRRVGGGGGPREGHRVQTVPRWCRVVKSRELGRWGGARAGRAVAGEPVPALSSLGGFRSRPVVLATACAPPSSSSFVKLGFAEPACKSFEPTGTFSVGSFPCVRGGPQRFLLVAAEKLPDVGTSERGGPARWWLLPAFAEVTH